MGDELIGADSEDGRGEADAPGGRPPSGMAAGTAYLVHPDDGPGPGVLVLSSWRGLNGATKAVADSLADAGFTALAPDLFGSVPADDAAGQALLAEMLGWERIGIALTEGFQLDPEQSTSALVVHHPEAEYISA